MTETIDFNPRAKIEFECRIFLHEISLALFRLFENRQPHVHMIAEIFEYLCASPSYYTNKNIDYVKELKETGDISDHIVNKYYGNIAKNIKEVDPQFDGSIQNINHCVSQGKIKFIPYKCDIDYINAELFPTIKQIKCDNGESCLLMFNSFKQIKDINSFVIDYILEQQKKQNQFNFNQTKIFSIMRKKFLILYNPIGLTSEIFEPTLTNHAPNIFIKSLNLASHFSYNKLITNTIIDYLSNPNANHKRLSTKIENIKNFQDYISLRVITKQQLDNNSIKDIKIELDKIKNYNIMKAEYTW